MQIGSLLTYCTHLIKIRNVTFVAKPPLLSSAISSPRFISCDAPTQTQSTYSLLLFFFALSAFHPLTKRYTSSIVPPSRQLYTLILHVCVCGCADQIKVYYYWTVPFLKRNFPLSAFMPNISEHN